MVAECLTITIIIFVMCGMYLRAGKKNFMVAILPLIINIIATAFNATGIGSLAFGGTSIIIVVGVALETTREIETQMTMRNYKGFL